MTTKITGANCGDEFALDVVAPALSDQEREAHKVRLVSLIKDTWTKCLYEINEGRQAKSSSSSSSSAGVSKSSDEGKTEEKKQ